MSGSVCEHFRHAGRLRMSMNLTLRNKASHIRIIIEHDQGEIAHPSGFVRQFVFVEEGESNQWLRGIGIACGVETRLNVEK